MVNKMNIAEISLVKINQNEFNLDKFDALRLMQSGKKVIDINGYVYNWNNGITRKKLADDSYITSDKFISGEINQFKEYIKEILFKGKLIEYLKELKNHCDTESAHIEADNLLLEYICDDEITEAFKDIEKWYA